MTKKYFLIFRYGATAKNVTVWPNHINKTCTIYVEDETFADSGTITKVIIARQKSKTLRAYGNQLLVVRANVAL